MELSTILAIVGLILFTLAGLGVGHARAHLGWFGAALVTLAYLLQSGQVGAS